MIDSRIYTSVAYNQQSVEHSVSIKGVKGVGENKFSNDVVFWHDFYETS